MNHFQHGVKKASNSERATETEHQPADDTSEEKRSWFRKIPKREWPERQPDEIPTTTGWSQQDGINWINP